MKLISYARIIGLLFLLADAVTLGFIWRCAYLNEAKACLVHINWFGEGLLEIALMVISIPFILLLVTDYMYYIKMEERRKDDL